MVQVELTYDMAKAIGSERFEVEARTVAEAVAAARARFGDDADRFEELSSRAAVAVNGVLVRYRKRLATELNDGDRVTFVKAAAGG